MRSVHHLLARRMRIGQSNMQLAVCIPCQLAGSWTLKLTTQRSWRSIRRTLLSLPLYSNSNNNSSNLPRTNCQTSFSLVFVVFCVVCCADIIDLCHVQLSACSSSMTVCWLIKIIYAQTNSAMNFTTSRLIYWQLYLVHLFVAVLNMASREVR